MARKKSSAATAAVDAPVSEVRTVYEEEQREIDLDAIVASPFRYRAPIDPEKVGELASSIRQFGVLERLITRPVEVDGEVRDELIAGERRWHAARAAGLATVPVTRKLGVPDDVALEMQITENCQREDPHPLDECDGFVALRDRFGRTPEEIAARISRPVRYVYDRLRLEVLTETSRKAYLEGSFGLGVAAAVARVTDPKRQDRCVKELLERHRHFAGQISISEARAHVRDRYMLRLAGAAFDITAEDLAEGVGACGPCPKRSGNQGVLFAEEFGGADDLCTDPACWDRKREAHWTQVSTQAEKRGLRVLSPAESKKLLPTTWGAPAAGYVDLNKPDYALTGGRPWSRVLGKKRLGGVEVVLAQDEQGRPVELARKDALVKAVQAAPTTKDPKALLDAAKKKKTASAPTEDPFERKLAGKMHAAVALGTAIEARGGTVPIAVSRSLVSMVLVSLIEGPFGDDLETFCKTRGWPMVDEPSGEVFPPEEVLAIQMLEMTAAQLLGLMAAALVVDEVPFLYNKLSERVGGAELIDRVFEALEVDRQAEQLEGERLWKEAKVAERKAAKAPAARAKKKGTGAIGVSGVCRYCGCTEDRGCDEGCSWVDAAMTMCTAEACLAAHEEASR